MQVPMKEDRGEHYLVELRVACEVAHQLQALELAGTVQDGVEVVDPVLAGALLLFMQLLVLAPPDLRDAADQPVDLLHVRGHEELREDLLEARHDARAEERDGVDELEPQGVREREVLAEEHADLGGTDGALLQELGELQREVPHAADGDEERQALPGPLVEDLGPELLEAARVGQALKQGLPGDEERRQLEVGDDLAVLVDLGVGAVLPHPREPVAVAMRYARADGIT
mmetsp:Transcript_37682/g.106477  ORF Transcript_37682/g.106477 Transcript_37682/m.106477 type:complete len:229 (+) Transcript_37682:826-1512(+)